jgi:hypothetical protein
VISVSGTIAGIGSISGNAISKAILKVLITPPDVIPQLQQPLLH